MALLATKRGRSKHLIKGTVARDFRRLIFFNTLGEIFKVRDRLLYNLLRKWLCPTVMRFVVRKKFFFIKRFIFSLFLSTNILCVANSDRIDNNLVDCVKQYIHTGGIKPNVLVMDKCHIRG